MFEVGTDDDLLHLAKPSREEKIGKTTGALFWTLNTEKMGVIVWRLLSAKVYVQILCEVN